MENNSEIINTEKQGSEPNCLEYTLPFPDITKRSYYKAYNIYLGDVLAFEYRGRTGIMFMENDSFFLFAVNLYEEEGRIWTSGMVPDGIIFYESTVEEQIWAMEKYLEITSMCGVSDKEHELPLIGFIEKSCLKGAFEGSSSEWYFCFRLLSLAPWFQFIKNKKETAMVIWKETEKGIKDTGLLFNANKTELYCFLMGVLMIADANCEYEDSLDCPPEYKSLNSHDLGAISSINKLHRNWDHFSWMYAMVIGRIIGNYLDTFTAMANQLYNKKRVGYLHLYLPLLERNIDKICKYSPKDKRWKLQNAILKAKEMEQLNVQNEDLDDLYKNVFPSYFLDSMSENRPASTIKELKEELASKDEQINRWKEMAENLSKTVKEMKQCSRNNALPVEVISNLILSFDVGVDRFVYHLFDDELENDEDWQKGRLSLLSRIKQKKEEEKKKEAGGTIVNVAAGGINIQQAINVGK